MSFSSCLVHLFLDLNQFLNIFQHLYIVIFSDLHFAFLTFLCSDAIFDYVEPLFQRSGVCTNLECVVWVWVGDNLKKFHPSSVGMRLRTLMT